MAPFTVDDLHNLPPTVDLMTAARALGIGRTKAYELARTDQFPCRVIRIGELYRVPTADLLRLLGVPTDDRDVPPKTASGHSGLRDDDQDHGQTTVKWSRT
ncbi:MAG: helix-turn-helix domain-containing protein [Streptosporangiales bacterium]|nr:helix-turn-helix domain-containing protein [Streptosporangiales bacterium]